MPVHVENRDFYRGIGVYIGRSNDKEWQGSLANPYTHLPLEWTRAKYQVATREQAVALYRDYAYAQFDTNPEYRRKIFWLAGRVYKGEDVALVCHCKQPDREVACHGDVICEIVNFVIDFGLLPEQSEEKPF